MTGWDTLPRSARRRARRIAGHNSAANRTEAGAAGRRRVPRVTADTDTGCRAAPSCLNCPLSLCIYEDPRGPRAAIHAGRDTEIWRLYRTGWTAEALARRYNLSRRQVFRILSRVRAEQAKLAPQLPLPLDPKECQG